MKKRCIMIFPKFNNLEIINKIREKYDPLANHVAPHITLVFPFESDIEKFDLENHISSVIKDISPFEIILKGITPVNYFGLYLFLNIEKGIENIIDLHKRLYTGILKDYYPSWLNEGSFSPHITVGSFKNKEDYEIAINNTKNINDTFRTIVTEITVEIIDENENSIIESNISLK